MSPRKGSAAASCGLCAASTLPRADRFLFPAPAPQENHLSGAKRTLIKLTFKQQDHLNKACMAVSASASALGVWMARGHGRRRPDSGVDSLSARRGNPPAPFPTPLPSPPHPPHTLYLCQVRRELLSVVQRNRGKRTAAAGARAPGPNDRRRRGGQARRGEMDVVGELARLAPVERGERLVGRRKS